MIYRGRSLDPVSLWERFVDFPHNMPDSGFAPLVRCPNPEHMTNKKHFQINLDQPLVHCFTYCGISGTYEHAIAMIEGVTEREARRIIVRATSVSGGVSSKRGRRPDKRGGRSREHDEAPLARASLDFETRIPGRGMDYLALRGIGDASIARFEIGWDSTDLRIVIPAKDERGVTRFLIKRSTRDRDWPKYLYAPDGVSKTSLLFGACHLDRSQVQSQGLILVEGSLDAVRLHQHGFRNAVAILGTNLSGRQAKIISDLRPRRILCLFDKDIAGWHNIQSVERSIRKLPIFVCLYPRDKKDPAELSRREVETSVSNAIPLVKFKQRLPEALRRREMSAYA